MSFMQTEDMRAAKDQLLKELIRNSPKKYKAIIISKDDYDNGEDDASEVMMESPKKEEGQHKRRRHSHRHSHRGHRSNKVLCSRCSREIQENARTKSFTRHHHRCPPQSYTPDPKIQMLIERRIQKARMQQAMEQRRREAEAVARARAQYEMERKQKVEQILAEVRMRKELERQTLLAQQAKFNEYSDYYSDYDYSDNEYDYDEEQDNEVAENLKEIAANLQKASEKLSDIVNTSMSPKKGNQTRHSRN